MRIEYNADGWVCHRYPTDHTDGVGFIDVTEEEHRRTMSAPYGYAWAVVDGALELRACATDPVEDAAIRVAYLRTRLAETDYYVIKKAEGRTVEGYDTMIAQRQAWRDEINALQSEYGVE